jgi:hypothetical protein
MFPVVEAWQQSGLSKKSFCEEQGIIKSVFLYWVRKYRDEHEPDGFCAIDLWWCTFIDAKLFHRDPLP